ncbi:hypothetical protein [Sciscionella marina]|uniref:hypothetical protein n=1 Tax=Sciscionella marina TaxID=508770 RepID=UPI00037A3D60|nr:hypothetical protein [Sciscionella marina]
MNDCEDCARGLDHCHGTLLSGEPEPHQEAPGPVCTDPACGDVGADRHWFVERLR